MSPSDLRALAPLVRRHISWTAWEQRIEEHGVTIDRPARTSHPEYPSVVYPMDYGYLPDTLGTDGAPADVFVGTGSLGLVGTLLTTDHCRGDEEAKLLYNCTPPEVYTAHGFINYDRSRLEGVVVLRTSMSALWGQYQRRSDA